MKMMTSAYANKLLRSLDEEKAYYLDLENESCTYVAAQGETAVIPEFDFLEVTEKINNINEQIQVIKHAINKANVSAQIEVGDKTYSVDRILVRMAQLNRRKTMMDYLRRKQPKTRKETYSYSAKNLAPEYEYINYDVEDPKRVYEELSEEIMEMQLMLDKYNQTFEFEVHI